MKVSASVNTVTLSNTGSTSEFRIRNSAKAFSILSSGLYQNKIKAIIRELSTNAFDSHVAAGKIDIPFEVHLPSMLEPWFSVKDFGLGLDGDQVKNIYTTYFESTKRDSNDFVGALGLGSKSPFSYTENFTVTAIKYGTKRIYSAFINEMGVPSIVEMACELTDEQNGVEVKFSVTDRYDYNSFKHEASDVFVWFKNKPTITGVAFKHSSPEYTEKNIVPGIHRKEYGRSMAIMGNIAYPIELSEPAKHFGQLANLLQYGIVIEFNIGDLDFTASRESLSYIPLTINSIKTKLEILEANMVTHISKQADIITDEWLRAEYLQTQASVSMYKNAVAKYVADTNFLLYDSTNYYGKKVFNLRVLDLVSKGLSIVGFTVSGYTSRTSTMSGSSTKVNGVLEKSVHIPVDSTVVFVLNDLKTGCLSRARYHFSVNGTTASVVCLSHTDTDIAKRQIAYDTLLKELHNPPRVLMASSLKKKEPVKRDTLSNKGIMQLYKSDPYWKSNTKYKWKPYTEQLSEKETYYYVCLNNNTPETANGEAFDISKLKELMSDCGHAAVSDISIFGVRKNRMKEIESLQNWVWIEEKIKEEVMKISDSAVLSLIAKDSIDSYSHREYINKKVAQMLPQTSDYVKYVTWYSSITTVSGNASKLAELCKIYGKTVDLARITDQVKSEKQKIINKYPLLSHISGAAITDIADYIHMIDSKDIPMS